MNKSWRRRSSVRAAKGKEGQPRKGRPASRFAAAQSIAPFVGSSPAATPCRFCPGEWSKLD
jgi:hypothetical protein